MAWTSDTIFANGFRQHYTRTGGDKPPLVLLHGLTDNGLYWSTLTKALERDYDVVMPDARGHGLSDHVDTTAQRSWQDGAEDAAALMTQLGIKNAIVIGHSMGAATAVVLAARYPELTRLVVLEDPPLFSLNQGSEDDGKPLVDFNNWERHVAKLQVGSRQERIAAARSEHPTWAKIELERCADTKEQFDLRTFRVIARPMIDWPDVISKIQCPVLLVTGDPKLGAIITPEVAQTLMSATRKGQLVNISDAGHSVRLDQPEVYLKAVREFLTAHS
jgi:N-formylmaleamate deformylase